jgi:hypothetical protein
VPAISQVLNGNHPSIKLSYTMCDYPSEDRDTQASNHDVVKTKWQS